MLTRAEGRKQRGEIFRGISREQKRMAREKLRALSLEIRSAKALRRATIARTRAACRAARADARRRAQQMRARVRLELTEAARLERVGARATCDASKREARASVDAHASSRAALAAERQFRRDMRRIERGNKARRKEAKAHGKARAGEHSSESDDEVRGNIPPELVALFNRVRGKIKAGSRWTRTEAFLHYAEEHPGESWEVLEGGDVDARMRELERQASEARRTLRRSVVPF